MDQSNISLLEAYQAIKKENKKTERKKMMAGQTE
jgi:hypothetical protein